MSFLGGAHESKARAPKVSPRPGLLRVTTQACSFATFSHPVPGCPEAAVCVHVGGGVSQPHHLLTMETWAGDVTSRSLSFPTVK